MTVVTYEMTPFQKYCTTL